MAERSYNGRNIYTRQIDSLVTGDVATTVSGNMESSNNSGWYLIVGATAASAEFDSSEKRTGAYTLKLSTLDALGRCSCFYGDMPGLTIPVKPNSTYTVKIYAKTNNAATAAVYLGATEYSSRGGIFLRNTNTNNLSGTNDWTLLEATFTTHPRTTTLFLYCQIAVAGNISDAWFDVNSLQLLEVLPARTLATSRTAATNRVAVRDMGTALRFDGSGDRVSLPAGIRSVVSKSSTEFTLSVWFRPTAVSGTYQIFGSAVDTNDRFAVTISASTLRIGIWNGASWNSGSGGRTVQPGVWSNLTVVSAGGLITAAYLNGILYAPQGGVNPVSSGTAGTFVGIRSDGTTEAFLGVIDEPRIWNRALTATEIQNLYLYDVVPTDGLVAEYLFDEASGTTAIDSSGNGNDGTITGATYTTDTPLRLRTSV